LRPSPSLTAAVLAFTFLHAPLVRGQATTASMKPRIVMQANPLGLLQFGPTAEIERFVTPRASLATGLRVPTLGLLTHVIDDQIGLAWTVMGSVRFYLDSAAAPRGWWIAPRVEIGQARSGSETYSVKGGAGEVGHRWIRDNGLAISAGAMAGAFKSASGLEGKFIMGVLSLGKVR
jgi:hypothetical protein